MHIVSKSASFDWIKTPTIEILGDVIADYPQIDVHYYYHYLIEGAKKPDCSSDQSQSVSKFSIQNNSVICPIIYLNGNQYINLN